MPTCSRCHRRGVFLRLNDAGLCAECQEEIARNKYQELLALQILITGKPSSVLTMSEDHIVSMAQLQYSRYIEIIGDCVSLVNSTSNPDTFYGRYDILLDMLNRLIALERVKASYFTADKPSQILENVKHQHPDVEADMWKRCYNAHLKKAAERKTEKGKQAQLAAFEALAAKYADRITPQGRAAIEECRARWAIEVPNAQT